MACSRAPEDPAGSISPRPHLEIVEALRQDLEAERHPSDGGGAAWIVEDDSGNGEVMAGRPSQWTLVYEAGPLGIAEGGWIFFQAPPFWGWSSPQVTSPEWPGFTVVSSDVEGLELDPLAVDEGLLGIQIQGQRMLEGDRVTIVYGASEQGAIADRFAEGESRFFVAVDGDGDGIRKLVEADLSVRVLPGPPAQLIALLPSTAQAGDRVRLTLAVLDSSGSAGVEVEGEIRLAAEGLRGLPTALEMTAEQRGVLHLQAQVEKEGVWRVVVEGPGGLTAESNPLVARAGAETIAWGDLHGHSALSDGTGTFEEYFRYARDVAALDVAALTDHDHWGMEPLALNPRFWSEIRHQVETFYRPGRFVTVLGYEWTSWIQGHRHVLYFDSEGEVLSFLDPEYQTPAQLWEALRGRPAVTVAHHSAGGPIPINWQYPPDPELEPVTEIVSVHGSSEALDSPGLIYSPLPGNFVRDVLDQGYRLGFVGSGDSHDGHPGLAHLGSPSGGLVAFLTGELTRAAILEALRGRRVYATNGPRIVLGTRLAGQVMGSELAVDDLASGAATLEVWVEGTEALDRVDVIRSGGIHATLGCEAKRSCNFEMPLEGLRPGEYVYLRAVQADGGAAWSSPYFLR